MTVAPHSCRACGPAWSQSLARTRTWWTPKPTAGAMRIARVSCSTPTRRLSSNFSAPTSRSTSIPARRVAIIGSGPSGFYTAHHIFQKLPTLTANLPPSCASRSAPPIQIDMYEKLPVPFGLARYGVAPDHPEVRSCTSTFAQVAQHPCFRFVGNVEVGTDLPLSLVLREYDAVVLAYGAGLDRELGIEGERTGRSDGIGPDGGLWSAREFVGWYNGVPEPKSTRSTGPRTHREGSVLAPDLSAVEDVVVIGQGNVALDVARILLTPVSALAKTDISESALDTLAKSRVKRVRVVGRRGPAQAAFTIKELREMTNLPLPDGQPGTVTLEISPRGVVPGPELRKGMDRPARRMMELLAKVDEKAGSPSSADGKVCSLDFFLSPRAFISGPSSSSAGAASSHTAHSPRLAAVEFNRTGYVPVPGLTPSELQKHNLSRTARVSTRTSHPGPTDSTGTEPGRDPEVVTFPAQLAIRSVGYRATPLSGFDDPSVGIAFDHTRGVVSHDGAGRVLATVPVENAGDDESGRKGADMPDPHRRVLPGVYCAGWLKRGPTGVIAHTMADAFGVAEVVLTDLFGRGVAIGTDGEGGATAAAAAVVATATAAPGLARPKGGWENIEKELRASGVRPVSWAEWEAIDAAERGGSRAEGVERRRMVSVDEMLRVLDA